MFTRLVHLRLHFRAQEAESEERSTCGDIPCFVMWIYQSYSHRNDECVARYAQLVRNGSRPCLAAARDVLAALPAPAETEPATEDDVGSDSVSATQLR